MANLPENNSYTQGVYQIETTDPVQGGPGGISNEPHRHLANRTNWLKREVELRAPLDSPALTGSPTAPTPATSENSTKLATTEFVKNLFPTLDNSTDSFTLPNGLTLKWGTTQPIAPGPNGIVTITFPLSFSTNVYQVMAWLDYPIIEGPMIYKATASPNDFSVAVRYGGSGAPYTNKLVIVHWFAIGY